MSDSASARLKSWSDVVIKIVRILPMVISFIIAVEKAWSDESEA
ncbi:MAG: hypothetical protein [Microvirus sp.]|nr:MAG: hypothetical protein [Microvirus sp.]